MKINLPAEDYHYREIVNVAASVSGPTPFHYSFAVELTITWGNIYGDVANGIGTTSHGIRLTWVNRWHSGSFSHDLILRIPGINLTETVSGSGWLDPADIDLCLVNKYLNTDCAAWAVHWEGIVLKLGGVTVYSDSSTVDMSGTGFQVYYNTQYLTNAPAPSLLGPPDTPLCGSCPSTPPVSWTDSIVEIAGSIEFWWTHGGVTEDITIEHDQPIPPQSGCSCLPAVSTGYPNEGLTGHAVIPVYSTERFTRTESTGECFCDGVSMGTYPIGYYSSIWEGYVTIFKSDERTGPNRITVETSGSRCWSTGGTPPYTESTPTTTARTEQYARWYVYGFKVLQTVGCPEKPDSYPVCVPGIGAGSGVLECTPIDPCIACKGEVFSSFDWPIDTPCACPDDEIHLTRSKRAGAVYTVAIQPASGIRFQRYSKPGIAEEHNIAAGAIPSAQVAVDPRGNVLVVYEQGGSVKFTRSYGKGRLWTVPVEIAPGSWPACAIDPNTGAQYVSLHDDGIYHLYRSSSHRATFELIGDIVACDNADKGRCALEFSGAKRHALFFAYQQGANVLMVRTFNFGQNWTHEQTIGAGTKVALAVNDASETLWAALLVSGIWKLFRCRGTGSWSLIGDIVAGGKQAGMEVDPGGLSPLVWIGWDGACVIRLYCPNDYSHWS